MDPELEKLLALLGGNTGVMGPGMAATPGAPQGPGAQAAAMMPSYMGAMSAAGPSTPAPMPAPAPAGAMGAPSPAGQGFGMPGPMGPAGMARGGAPQGPQGLNPELEQMLLASGLPVRGRPTPARGGGGGGGRGGFRY